MSKRKILEPPGPWYRRVFRSSFYFDILLAVGSIIIGLVTTIQTFQANPPQKFAGIGYLIGAVLVFVAAVCRAVSAKIRERDDEAKNDQALEVVLHVAHAVLSSGTAPRIDDAGLRLAIFVPKSEEQVVQLTNYVGVEPRSGGGKIKSRRAGIVGKSLRSVEVIFDKLPNETDLSEFLVSHYGFSRPEAAHIRKDAKAWAAVPVGSPPVAVIFADSSHADFFGRKDSPRRRAFESFAIGVAECIQ